jgi:U3 small nucleolar RNA-associated protein 7
LSLNYGDYSLDYTRDGNHLLLSGSQGHIAMMEWKSKKLALEFNVKDKVRDVKFMQNHLLFAVSLMSGSFDAVLGCAKKICIHV